MQSVGERRFFQRGPVRVLFLVAVGLGVPLGVGCEADSGPRPPEDTVRAGAVLDAADSEKESAAAGSTPKPIQARLQGTLQLGEFMGPPNYGELPASDAIERQFYLQLPGPARAQQVAIPLAPEWAGGDEYFIQPVFLEDSLRAKARALVGKRVVVTGALEPAVSGHHRTSLLLVARSIDSVKTWRW